MNFKKLFLPFAAGALALSLAACSEDEDTATEETPQEETPQNEENQEGASEEQAADIQAKLAEQQVDDSEVVAIVNGQELTGTDYNAALTSVQGQMQQAGQDPTSEEVLEQIKAQALDTVVNQTLILQQAKEEDVTASENEVDERYATLEEQYGGEEALSQALTAQGMDIETLKLDIKDSILFEKYQDKVVPADEVKEEEIQAYYDQVAAQSEESGQELPPFEEVREEIAGILKEQQQQEKMIAHLEELKESAEIELKI